MVAGTVPIRVVGVDVDDLDAADLTGERRAHQDVISGEIDLKNRSESSLRVASAWAKRICGYLSLLHRYITLWIAASPPISHLSKFVSV